MRRLFLIPLLLPFLLFVDTASASTYTVLQCGSGSGGGVLDTRTRSAGEAGPGGAWTENYSSTVGGMITRPTSGSTACHTDSGVVYAGVVRTGTSTPANGAALAWVFDAPDGMTISRIEGEIATCRNPSGVNTPLLPQLTARPYGSANSQANVFAPVQYSTSGHYFTTASNSCATLTSSFRAFTWAASGSTFLGTSRANLPSSTTQFAMRLFCSSSCGTTTGQYSAVRNLRITLADNSAPTASISTAYGTLGYALPTNNDGYKSARLIQGVPHVGPDPIFGAGNVNINQSVADQGGGLSLGLMTIFGNSLVARSNSFSCLEGAGTYPIPTGSIAAGQTGEGSYPVRMQPCPVSATASGSLADISWKEGTNRIASYSQEYTSASSPRSAIATEDLVIDTVSPGIDPSVGVNGCFNLNLGQYNPTTDWWYDMSALIPGLGGLCISDITDDLSGASQVAGLDLPAAVDVYQSGVDYSEEILALGPVGYWPLDNASTGLNNISGQDSAGNLVPVSSDTSFTSVQTPIGSGAWNFSGVPIGGLQVENLLPSNGRDSVAFAGLVRPTRSSGGDTIASQYTEVCTLFCRDVANLLVLRNSDGGITVNTISEDGSSATCSSPAGSLPQNQWSYLVVSRTAEGENTPGTIRISVNGSSLQGSTSGCDNNNLGKLPNGEDTSFSVGSNYQGQMSRIALFFGDISEWEASTLYAASCANLSSPCKSSTNENGLFGYIKSQEGESTIFVKATDRVGNSAWSSSTQKLDLKDPTVNQPKCSGTEGENSWYTAPASCLFLAADNISKPEQLGFEKTLNGNTTSQNITSTSRSRTNLLLNARGAGGRSSWISSGLQTNPWFNDPRYQLSQTMTDGSSAHTAWISGGNGQVYSQVALQAGKRYVCSVWGVRFLDIFGGPFTISWRSSTGEVLSTGNSISNLESTWKRLEVAYTPSSNMDARCTLSGAGSLIWTNAIVEEVPFGSALPFFDGFSIGADWQNSTLPGRSQSSLSGSLREGSSVIAEEGQTSLRGLASDFSGRGPIKSDPLLVKIDRSDPVASPTTCPSPDGSGGWHITSPSCSASGEDAVSGVSTIERSLDGGSLWSTILGPLSVDGTNTAAGNFSLPEGEHTLRARVKDRSGRQSLSSTQSAKVDLTNPQTALQRSNCSQADGDNGWNKSTVTCTMQSTDSTSKPDSGEYAINSGSSYSAWTAIPFSLPTTSSTRSGSFTVSTQGNISLKGRSRDYAGRNSVDTDPITLKIDTTQPSAQIDGCSSGSGWLTYSPVCTFGASDRISLQSDNDFSGISTLERSLDGGSSWQTVYGPYPSDGQSSISSSQFGAIPEGDNSVVLRVRDRAGNIRSINEQIKVDLTDPSVELQRANCSPADGNNGWNKTDVTCQITGTDTASKPAKAYYALNNNNAGWSSWNEVTPFSGTGDSRSASFTITTSARWGIKGKVDDVAGRNKESSSFTVKIDKQSPAATVSGCSSPTSSGWYRTTPVCTFTGTDSISGVASVESSINGGSSWQSSAALTSEEGITPRSGTRSLPDGTYSLRAKTTDIAGLQSTSSSTTVRVDTERPALSSLACQGTSRNGWYRSDVSCSVLLQDTTSGPSKIEHNWGSGWVQTSSTSQSGNLLGEMNRSQEGVHNLEARGEDVAGWSTANSAAETVRIDKTAPIDNAVLPAPGQPYRPGITLGRILKKEGAFSDDLSGLEAEPTCWYRTETTSGEIDCDELQLQPGLEYRYEWSDLAGNVARNGSSTFDWETPEIDNAEIALRALEEPSPDWRQEDATIAYEAETDSPRGINRIVLRQGLEIKRSKECNGDSSCTVEWDWGEEGEHNLEVIAYGGEDPAGEKAEASEQFTLRIDKTAPVVRSAGGLQIWINGSWQSVTSTWPVWGTGRNLVLLRYRAKDPLSGLLSWTPRYCDYESGNCRNPETSQETTSGWQPFSPLAGSASFIEGEQRCQQLSSFASNEDGWSYMSCAFNAEEDFLRPGAWIISVEASDVAGNTGYWPPKNRRTGLLPLPGNSGYTRGISTSSSADYCPL